MYECFHCGSKSVVWDSDFSYEDYGLDGEGIIHVCHCSNCDAFIEYYVPIEEGEPKDQKPNEWIPYPQIPPDKFGHYLVQIEKLPHIVCPFEIATYEDDYEETGDYNLYPNGLRTPGFYILDEGFGYRKMFNVIAWMPLPEAYREHEMNGEHKVEIKTLLP